MFERLPPFFRALLRAARSVLSVAAAVVAFMVLIAYLDHLSKSVNPKEAQCRQDVKCWGASNVTKTRACIAPIEQLLEYDFK